MRYLLLVMGVWLLPGGAHAGLWAAQAELELEFAELVFVGNPSITDAGLTTLEAAGATFVGTQPLVLDSPPLTGGSVSVSNGPGSFSGNPLEGTMPIRGSYSLTGFGGSVLVALPLALPVGSGPVTRGLGVGGTIMATASFLGTATFGPWSSGTVTIANVATPDGTGTIMRTGAVIPAHPAEIRLVSPVRIVSEFAPPTGSFATLTYIIEAPEPALPALLGLGSVVLAVAGCRKLRLVEKVS